MTESAAYDPLHQDQIFDRPSRPSKAEKRRERQAEKAAKNAHVSKPLEPLNQNQADYIDDLKEGWDVLALGPAGTGKTYIAGRFAARALIDGKVEKIVVSRVTVSDRRHALGFLPGGIDGKMGPWIQPIIDGIRAEVSGATLDKWKAEGKFCIVPFEYMRGRSFHNSFVILDEAQNATLADLKLFTTRGGKDSQVVIAGDPDQADIPDSGLELVANLADRFEIMSIIEFTEADVVRSEFARKWVQAFAALSSEQKRQAILDKPRSSLKVPCINH